MPQPRRFDGAIFDLDGVLVDTARLHFLAWRRLAQHLGIEFTEADNERLKGVSRDESLAIMLSIGGLSLPPEERRTLAARKNQWYVDEIATLTPADLLPGALHCLGRCKTQGIPAALASASRNAAAVLRRLAIARHFRAVLDGNCGAKAKPDPELFHRAAALMAIPAHRIVVFEDASAGIAAAHAAGMYAVGIGKPESLPGADLTIPDLSHCPFDDLFGSHP